MSEQFFDRKMRTFFKRLDSNNDGFLTREDFTQIAERFCQFENSDSGRRKTATDKYTQFYDYFYANGGKDGKITEDEWAAAVKNLRPDPEFQNLIGVVAYNTFNLLDRDGDGHISLEEFTNFSRSIQVPDAEINARFSFEVLDSNGDGEISFDEYKEGLLGFWFSEDESCPGTTFYGPLV